MSDSYEIRFDEYDEPFLAHASGGWKQHKYLMKIPNALGDGKTLYLYTQKEIDAWQNGKRRTLSNRLRDILGYDERDRAIDARNEHENAQKRFRSETAKTAGKPQITKLESMRYMRSKDREKQTRQESEAADKAYKRSVVGVLDTVKEFLGNALSSITGRSKKADEVIEKNADVPMTEVNKKMAASQSAAINAQTGSNQKAATPEAKMASSQNKAIEGSSGSSSQKGSAQNQNGSSEDKNSIASMRKVAMKVLRGDYGNGSERAQKLRSMGYDPTKIQVVAGNLQWARDNDGSYEAISDKELEDILKWVD